MQKTNNWSNNWKSSKNPSKQRKYRNNAPQHVKDKIVSANLSKELREELGTRSIPIRTGDRARVMRGDEKGKEGIVSTVDREEEKIFINDITAEKTDGTNREKPIRPSNIQIQALNIEDPKRLQKYGVEELEEVGVEKEEMEEVLEEDEESEMMQQMQREETGEESEEEEETGEENDQAEENEEESEEPDYEEILSGTINNAKEKINNLENPDYEAALNAEKDNKDRKTLKEWLENKG